MKTRTEQEIRDFVDTLWVSPSWPNKMTVDVVVSTTEQRVDITIAQMYESPDLNLDLLMKLAEFFETKNINDDDRFGHGGCESCDYGSSYGFTLTVRPE